MIITTIRLDNKTVPLLRPLCFNPLQPISNHLYMDVTVKTHLLFRPIFCWF